MRVVRGLDDDGGKSARKKFRAGGEGLARDIQVKEMP
jgi:hypothetical protein